ncbi:flagellar motor protein MotB [Marinibactrum halimedae]|uniref:Flagellar motor protein MotB n=1 Tax=Marinibactrum halimedae TaxID=1444977 RepID=A0AA37T8X5_9GAMM|nr:flagellar motor protein MotB [Marinibactrum halimedae]MCD9461018.1 flagellar motor protein MotB [Marinibactrum halimedae]GLS27796.1 flagellar motor protein MotB [Marinibactrum halimedae]
MDEAEAKCDCEEGLPAWMGTFADLMSLLMCFFVLLLSFSEMDAMKFKRLAGSMAQAFGVQNKLNVDDPPKGTSIIAQEFSPGIPEPTPINEIFQSTDDFTEMSLEVDCQEQYDVEQGDVDSEAGVKVRIKQELEKLIQKAENVAQDRATELARALQTQIINGEMEIETRGRNIIIRIREKGSFKSGSAELVGNYGEVLADVRKVLAGTAGTISVEGHTDSLPIQTARFRSNFELSSSRAVSVAMELMSGAELGRDRFEVTGYADTKPLMSNETPDGRSRNRRVEIVVRQSLDNTLSEEDKALLKTEGSDILRELDIEPEYLFELAPDEIF